MISLAQLRALSRRSGLNLYQQEKDYALKLFLFAYYGSKGDAVFRGGTCLRYLHGVDRFSEDLDFNLGSTPPAFRLQVIRVLKELRLMGMDASLSKEESFYEAYTCEIGFAGPLFIASSGPRNKIRIDAGARGGTMRKPEWRLLGSEYPETGLRFLVLAMSAEEILAEKVSALLGRRKGRDLYDAWFLLSSKVALDRELLLRKGVGKLDLRDIVDRREYERDMRRLTRSPVPYEQAVREVSAALGLDEDQGEGATGLAGGRAGTRSP